MVECAVVFCVLRRGKGEEEEERRKNHDKMGGNGGGGGKPWTMDHGPCTGKTGNGKWEIEKPFRDQRLTGRMKGTTTKTRLTKQNTFHISHLSHGRRQASERRPTSCPWARARENRGYLYILGNGQGTVGYSTYYCSTASWPQEKPRAGGSEESRAT